MNHDDIEEARQVVMVQANVLQRLANQNRTTSDEKAHLQKEVIRLRKLASRLCDIRDSLSTQTAEQRAMRNWKPPTMSVRG